MDRIRLSICSSCAGERDRDAELRALQRALDQAGLNARVQLDQHACFSSCETPVAIALQGQGLASYIFAGVDVITDAEDIAATCQTYLKSHAGWIEDARPCGRLRMCLRARVPAL
ncbi:hypothetical protein RKLH11_2060 [Rhodobacteraceae bacterium KLH11]|nr:hypothetical protein RKLH11_2060 [Rhodobacteraceae bacterium KLH11]